MAEQTLTHRAKNFQDLTGQIFGRLAVLSFIGRFKKPKSYSYLWLCKCNCGKQTQADASHLRRGHTTSCGCYDRERRVTHGHAQRKKQSREYQTWRNIKNRCLNPNWPQFELYGGRGITICERWKDNFENFLTDMGKRPSGMEIDRFPDNNGNYEPGNCRWTTAKQQCRNMRSNRLITIDGETLTLAEWIEHSPLNAGAIRSRIYKGWPPRDALFAKPLRKSHKKLSTAAEHEGKSF
jgi:hypothetical protein